MNKFPNITKPISLIGLKSCSQEEILEMMEFYKEKDYKVVHKTHLENGNKLPYNGVLEVDRRRKYLCFG